MTIEHLEPQLHMIRKDLQGLPPVELPQTYTWRTYTDGDSENWSRILAEAFDKEPENYVFETIMRSDPAFRPERVIFVVRGDDPVATASAFSKPSFMENAGMVHYVGVCGNHRGKKLGYWASLLAMHRMVEDGFTKAWLSTDDFRLPAIKTYLNLGFEPLLVHENQRERWRKLFADLGLPELSEKFKRILEGEIYVPETEGGEGP